MNESRRGVTIRKDLLDEMVEHCLRERPNEGCGILAASGGAVVRVLPMKNASASPVRYSLEPQEQFEVYRLLDERDWDLGAIFHSHTHTEAYPSPTDISLASEDVPYLIVSLAADPPAIRAFRIIKEQWTDQEGEIEEVPVAVTG